MGPIHGKTIITFLWVLVSLGVSISCENQTDSIRPEYVSHRGLHDIYPDNTIAAFQNSIENGYNNIEMDVVFSSDHQAFILHDEWLDPIFGLNIMTGEVSAADIDTMLIDHKYHIPHLEEVFDSIYPYCKIMMLDIKGVPDSLDLQNFLQTFKKYDCGKSVILSTENEILRKLSLQIPKHQLGTDGWVCADALSEAIDQGYGWWFVDVVRANKNYMSLAKSNKIKTVIYTINDKKQLSKTLEFNPEMILSDNPKLFLEEK